MSSYQILATTQENVYKARMSMEASIIGYLENCDVKIQTIYIFEGHGAMTSTNLSTPFPLLYNFEIILNSIEISPLKHNYSR